MTLDCRVEGRMGGGGALAYHGIGPVPVGDRGRAARSRSPLIQVSHDLRVGEAAARSVDPDGPPQGASGPVGDRYHPSQALQFSESRLVRVSVLFESGHVTGQPRAAGWAVRAARGR